MSVVTTMRHVHPQKAEIWRAFEKKNGHIIGYRSRMKNLRVVGKDSDDAEVAERVGFEPTYSFLSRNPISSRTRYDLFGTSPDAKDYQQSPFASTTIAGRRCGVPDPSFYARLGRLSAIVMLLPASMAAGWILGYGLDRLFGSFPIAAIVATLVGAVAGFYEIVRILMPEDRDSNGGPTQEG